MLTTAAAIYTMTEVMLGHYDITPKTRKNDEKLKFGLEFINDFWNRSLTEVDVFKEYKQYVMDSNPLEHIRKKNLLLKPVTQMALAQAVRIAMGYGFEYKDLTAKINKINWDPDFYVWSNVLVTNSSNKKMITGSKALKDAGSIIAYMLVGDKFADAEKSNILQIIRKANDDETLELPDVIE